MDCLFAAASAEADAPRPVPIKPSQTQSNQIKVKLIPHVRPQWRRFGFRADTKVAVAASRQSAAVFGFLYWRRSSETPQRGDGPRGLLFRHHLPVTTPWPPGPPRAAPPDGDLSRMNPINRPWVRPDAKATARRAFLQPSAVVVVVTVTPDHWRSLQLIGAAPQTRLSGARRISSGAAACRINAAAKNSVVRPRLWGARQKSNRIIESSPQRRSVEGGVISRQIHGGGPVPEGHLRIAQRFNVGSQTPGHPSPEGTAEVVPREGGSSAVPSGLRQPKDRLPNVETLGYSQVSLRDKGPAQPPGVLLSSNGYYFVLHARLCPVWNQAWVFYLTGVLFGMDWFLRRRWGLC